MRAPPAVSRIQRYTRSPDYRAERAKYVLDAIDRLVTRREMFAVWEAMPAARSLPSPFDFLAACEEALVAWARMPASSKKDIAKIVPKLASKAEELAAALDEYAIEINYFGVSLFVANHLASINGAQSHRPTSPLQPHKYGRHTLPPLYDPRGVVGPVQIQEILREFAHRIRERKDAWGHPFKPTKTRATDAKRTFLAKCLVYFFLTNGGNPRWEWVAVAVAALTGGDPLDVRHLQLIVLPMEPLFSDPGEEASWYTRIWEEEQDRLEMQQSRTE